MKRPVFFFLILTFFLVPLTASAQIYPPKPGVDMPQAYFERVKKDPSAFQFRHAWIEKAARLRDKRERFLKLNGSNGASLAAAGDFVVSGTTSVPVFLAKFNNTPSDPYPASNLQTELFSGPWPTGTMHDFYNEISYGNLNLTGTVYNWFQLSQNDTYYEGTSNGLGGDSKVGELLKEVLDNWDPTVDFGQYDNDGPDGIPNSGDDDGYVDFVSFVHAESGGECGNSNIWSHRWYYGGWWGGAPYTTNDPSASGGFIKVQDYTIQPALACDNTTMIQIGVFCHEFGHAFGLPDLYDTDGGSQGIGHWGLMGSGSWNQPTSPAHMCVWSKSQLGWIIPTSVSPNLTNYNINDVETNAQAYKLDIYEERWRRSTLCALSGTYSMHMGLTSSEGSARGWPGGDGYGNDWHERVARKFDWDGTTPVVLSYDYAYDAETNYDYCYLKINVNGVESTVRTYTGTGSGTETSIDLSSYLSGSGASYYYLVFEFDSDIGWSDEDGSYVSACNGPFTVDNISLNGGGVSYFTDFETYEDGWFEDDGQVDPKNIEPGFDYFLVENREAIGFDQYVHNSGLAIWHIDPDVAESSLGNTGGSSNNQTRGVKLMEADGNWDLMNNTNRGDAGDVFPGSANNLTFDNATTPSSLSNDGENTVAQVSSISPSGNTMTAMMSGGAFPPTVASITPSTGDNGSGVIAISSILGSGINYGAVFIFRDSLGTETSAQTVDWTGHGKISGTIDLTGLIPGRYDVIVQNPDGGRGILTNGFIVTGATGVEEGAAPSRYALGQNHPNPFNPSTLIPFDIRESSHVTLKIYDITGRLVRTLVDRELAARHYEERWDGLNDAGMPVGSGVYFYRLIAGKNFVSVKKMVLLK